MGTSQSNPASDELAALARETTFTQTELARLRETFAAAAGAGGAFTAAEFQRLFQIRNAELAGRIFAAFEVNLASGLAFAGFVRGGHALSSRATPAARRQVNNIIHDADHNGSISRQEFADIVRLSYLEKDPGYATPAAIHKVVRELYERVDQNGDGVVGWPEFLTECIRNPSFMACIDVDIERLTARGAA
jgi:Ca2+-binding EF-hand superfamily protein